MIPGRMVPNRSVCELCSEEVGQVNNHVRMSSDDTHGPQGAYPDGWDPSGGGRLVQDDVQDDGAETIVADDGADDGDDLAVLELGDDPADARTYDCGNCEATIDFLDDCDGCGAELAWGMV